MDRVKSLPSDIEGRCRVPVQRHYREEVWGAFMDQSILVDEQINDGKRLFDRLAEEGVAVTAACWLKESESGWWHLYIATPLVGEDGGKKQAYRRMNEVIRQTPENAWLRLLPKKAI